MFSSPIQAQQAPVAGSPLDHATPLVVGHRLTLHSSILDEDRTILLSLSENPQSGGAPMPVIYLLDGGAHFLHTVATMDLLSRRDKMPYSLVVGIANTDRDRDLTAVASSGRLSGGADRFLDFIESELIPFVETGFVTAPHRTLIGHSLGGSFVLHSLVIVPICSTPPSPSARRSPTMRGWARARYRSPNAWGLPLKIESLSSFPSSSP